MRITSVGRLVGALSVILSGVFVSVSASPVMDHGIVLATHHSSANEAPSVLSEQKRDLEFPDPSGWEGKIQGSEELTSSLIGPNYSTRATPMTGDDELGVKVVWPLKEPGSLALLGLGILALLLLSRVGRRR